MKESQWSKDRKEVNNPSTFDNVAKELVERLKGFDDEFNFGDIDAREEGTNRSYCKGFEKSDNANAKTTERRLCKCLYYSNNGNVKTECDKCALRDRQSEGYHAKLSGNFKVIYYEFVPTNKGNGIGNVDLILADDNFAYLTEVKPPQGNSETLLRMFLEIETYYRVTVKGEQYEDVVKGKPLRKAILFFKDSPQYRAYIDPACGLNTKELLKKFGITVFCAELTGEEVLIKAIG